MIEITEKKKVVGFLNTRSGTWEMLNLKPVEKFVSYDATSFQVVGAGGYGTTISVKGDFVVSPIMYDYEVDVKYIIEDGDEIEYNIISNNRSLVSQ